MIRKERVRFRRMSERAGALEVLGEHRAHIEKEEAIAAEASRRCMLGTLSGFKSESRSKT